MTPKISPLRVFALVAIAACKLFDNGSDAGKVEVSPSVASSAPTASTNTPIESGPIASARPDVIPTAGHITSISAGANMTCVIKAGAVTCWGIGRTKATATPMRVDGIDDAVAVAIGAVDACAVSSDGTVKCWFAYADGGMVDVSTHAPATPTVVAGIHGARGIAVGDHHACASTSRGTISCWGDNKTGQLGTCTNKSSTTAIDARDRDAGVITDASAVYASGNHTCALLAGDASTSRSLVCWGVPAYQVRSGDFSDTFPCPRRLIPATTASLELTHACALDGNELWCWGSNDSKEIVGADDHYFNPIKVLSGVSAVAAGSTHTCAVVGGAVRCWGSGHNGVLGDGVARKSLETVALEQSHTLDGLTDVVALAAGHAHTCALTASDRIFCWGDASMGQMGDGRFSASPMGPTIVQSTPIEVKLPN